MKVLLAGESWTTHSIHVKGFDSFTSSRYEEGARWLIEAVQKGGHEIDYLPGQYVSERFPDSLKALEEYDAVAVSDVGANTFYLSDDTFVRSQVRPDRLNLLREYAENGGGFLMIGGYLSFQGIDAKARYHDTPAEECLPVNISVTDDRVEVPGGVIPDVKQSDHPILKGIPAQWPHFLGYNRVTAKVQAEVLLTVGEDPFLTVADYGKGRTAAFASDCSPHWGTPEFVGWTHYNPFWTQLFEWLARKR